MEDKLRELIRESLIEEGVMDWLFSRWRKDGSWKGEKGIKRSTHELDNYISSIEQIYKSVGSLNNDFPRKAKLIRGNLLRVIRDLEDLLVSIERGRSERDV